MDLTKVKKEDLLLIENIKFQVVEVWEDLDSSLDKDEYFLDLGLVEIKSKKMTITHRLISYYDKEKIFLKNEINGNKKELKKEEIKKTSS